jgi:putative transposase
VRFKPPNDLTDFEWSVIEPLFPNKRRCVKPKRNRHVHPANRCALARVPERYGPYTACYNRFNRWREAGIGDRLMGAITKSYDRKVQMIDASVRVFWWKIVELTC